MSLLNDLGQTVLPQVFEALGNAGIVETLSIIGQTETVDTGGAIKKTAETTVYSDIFCSVEPYQRGRKFTHADKLLSSQGYVLTFPTHTNNSRINLNIKNHYLRISARGNEPAKNYKMISIQEQNGVVYEVLCQKEN